MVAEKSSLGWQLFPVVRIQFRTATRSLQIALSPAVQASALAGVVAAAAAFVDLGISQIGYVRLVVDEKLAIARAESANADMQDDIANLRDRLAVTTRDRTAAEDRLSVLASQADMLRDQLELTQVRLHTLEQKLSERETPQPGQTAETRPVEPMLFQPTLPEADLVPPEVNTTGISQETNRGADGVAEIGRRAIGEFKRALASVGVNVARLFSHFGVNHAEGGPFVPPTRADQPAGGIVVDGPTNIRGLVKTLPLLTPLEHYQVGSRFGPRRDPFNGRPAYHTGLDFDGAYMSPVYATAAGVVTYAGYRGAYGKVVEIDHGNGIVTLYGHMHRCTVSAGQKVEAHTQLGLLGSTGRASGPHVHYEVIVNGQPQDPEKFMELAHLVPIAEE